ncbi:MAG TPA: GNAT family N-acetyltransferase [Longimicrobiales bacterium]|nr:GNAT family N-acetyltransferase [Longimicrobiales bacterium]
MGSEAESIEVVNNERKSRFEAEVDGHLGVADYRRHDGRIEFTSTEVPPAVEGRGVGSALARAGLEHAKREGLEVVPTCPFIRSYIERHPEYQDLLAADA